MLQPRDDESTLLFIIASAWLVSNGYALSRDVNAFRDKKLNIDRIASAYRWVEMHVAEHVYLSPAGAFRFWADAVQPDQDESIAYNQGLFCLARRAMVIMGLGGVTELDVLTAQTAWRSMFDTRTGYLPLGNYSNVSRAQDNASLFPEWLSRYLYDEPILSDDMVIGHVAHIVSSASIHDTDGRLAGIKCISAENGDFLPSEWFFNPVQNTAGDYQNGGYWSLYTLVMLALAYSITRDQRTASLIEQLVRYELENDLHPKAVMSLALRTVGSFQLQHIDPSSSALIPVALRWAGVVT